MITFVHRPMESRLRIKFASFFLILFLQSAFYPVLIFHCYVDASVEGSPRSLPAEFPDNGASCYFGFNNNEEETQTENPCPLYETSIQEPQFLNDINGIKLGFRCILDHKSTHQEVATPPPELV